MVQRGVFKAVPMSGCAATRGIPLGLRWVDTVKSDGRYRAWALSDEDARGSHARIERRLALSAAASFLLSSPSLRATPVRATYSRV